MKVSSSSIVNGVINGRHGKFGSQFLKGMPTCSPALEFFEYPAATKSFALFMEDKDSVPVCGFSWIHWVAADILVPKVAENFSISANFPQGANSWSSGLMGKDAFSREESSLFGGCAPPDAPHSYDIHVYALNAVLGLKKGFYLNELFKAMEGHILSEGLLKGIYSN